MPTSVFDIALLRIYVSVFCGSVTNLCFFMCDGLRGTLSKTLPLTYKESLAALRIMEISFRNEDDGGVLPDGK